MTLLTRFFHFRCSSMFKRQVSFFTNNNMAATKKLMLVENSLWFSLLCVGKLQLNRMDRTVSIFRDYWKQPLRWNGGSTLGDRMRGSFMWNVFNLKVLNITFSNQKIGTRWCFAVAFADSVVDPSEFHSLSETCHILFSQMHCLATWAGIFVKICYFVTKPTPNFVLLSLVKSQYPISLEWVEIYHEMSLINLLRWKWPEVPDRLNAPPTPSPPLRWSQYPSVI